MADKYISKQDAVDAIHCDIASFTDGIKALEPADVVQVVRCKDCDCHGTCTHEQYLGLDGFCSYGERKED